MRDKGPQNEQMLTFTSVPTNSDFQEVPTSLYTLQGLSRKGHWARMELPVRVRSNYQFNREHAPQMSCSTMTHPLFSFLSTRQLPEQMKPTKIIQMCEDRKGLRIERVWHISHFSLLQRGHLFFTSYFNVHSVGIVHLIISCWTSKISCHKQCNWIPIFQNNCGFSKFMKIKTYLALPLSSFHPGSESKAKNYTLGSLPRINKSKMYITKMWCRMVLKPSFLNWPYLGRHVKEKHLCRAKCMMVKLRQRSKQRVHTSISQNHRNRDIVPKL